jgi:uncharacterized surface protein with fasciclin (FAS1) repeats
VAADEMFKDIDNTEQYDVLALARTSPNLSTFVKLMEQAGMVDGLQRAENITLFAPTNEAFAKIPKDQLEMLLNPSNKAQLIKVLQVHILPNEVLSTQFKDNQELSLSDDRVIPVNVDAQSRNSISVGGARIVMPDVKASNGVIQVVDHVILPSQQAVPDPKIKQ